MDLTTEDNRIYLHIEYQRATGVGTVLPRIQVSAAARTAREALTVTRGQLVASVYLGHELLGAGSPLFIGFISSLQTPLVFDVFVDRRALHYLQEQVTGPSLSLTLHLSGILWLRDGTPGEQRRTQAHIDFGDEAPVPVNTTRTGGGLTIAVARSDVYTQLLEPVGIGRYSLMEMPIPSVPDPERWRAALDHLAEAEKQWTLGNDAGVFSSCHAALESCTFAAGETKHTNLLAGIADEEKRKALDALIVKTKALLDSGRHVSKQPGSAQQGWFPVDHRDAEFARLHARLLVTYLAKLITP